jgi:hypothetical protein
MEYKHSSPKNNYATLSHMEHDTYKIKIDNPGTGIGIVLLMLNNFINCEPDTLDLWTCKLF